MDRNTKLKIFQKACLSRQFEERLYKEIEKKRFSYPLYLSAGQEFISASISQFFEDRNEKPLIFAQHRAHSIFLSFGGKPENLIEKLLNSAEGSASIQCKEIKMFGHDGLMGSQIPIAVGACFSSRNLTLAIMGDASAEEDYVMSAIAWAGTHSLPILFVVEDNNLSILTEKKVRRNWSMVDFARSVNVDAAEITDSPEAIYDCLNQSWINGYGLVKPTLLNIKTERLFWHANAGEDNYPKVDRYQTEKTEFEIFENAIKSQVNSLWDKALEKR